MKKTIGNNIRRQRLLLDISPDDIAEAINVTRQTVYNIEKGKRFGESFLKYLVELRKNGGNTNEIFTIKEEK